MKPHCLTPVKHRGFPPAAPHLAGALALLMVSAFARSAIGGPGTPGVVPVTMNEGDVGAKTYSFVFTSPIAGPFRFDYTTLDNSARAADGDYLPISGSFDLPAGQYQYTIDVTVRSDSTYEPDEAFQMVVGSPSTAIYSGAGTILNDDQLPRIVIDDASVTEGNSGSTQVPVSVRLDRDSYQTVTVHYSTIDGIASAFDHDYSARSGNLAFAPGDHAIPIQVPVTGDTKIEPNESFGVTLSSAANAILADATAFVTILNDDVPAPPAARVIRPNGGEAFVQGEQETVSWEANTPTVDVQISRDGGATWEVLGQNVYNVGYSFWKSEGEVTTQALVKVIARDALGRTADDVSDGVFAIVNDQSRIPTQTALAVVPAAPVCGDSIVLTATVTPAGATGVVSYTRNGIPIGSAPLDGAGHAVLRIAPLPIGTHAFQARYEGDVTYARSTSPSSITLNGTITSTTLSVPPSPSACGDPLRLEATITPLSASGTVTFRDGNTSLGNAALAAGTAVLTTNVLASGTHTLTAEYNGDGCHLPSTSSSASHVIEKKPTTVTLTPTPSPSECGGPVQLRAAVTPSTATGGVMFLDGANPLATVSIVSGVATLSTPVLAAGNHSLSARYLGDACHQQGLSPSVSHAVTKVDTDIDLIVQRMGCGVRLTAYVSPSPGSGSVLFLEDEQGIGTVALSAEGQAQLTLATILPGEHVFEARFLGTACFNIGDAVPVGLNTDPSSTTTSLTVTPSPGGCGAPLFLQASVSPAGAVGDVRFSRDGVTLGLAAVDVNGSANLSVTPTSTGTHTFVATYLGSGCSQASTAPEVIHRVDPNAGAVVTLSASPNPAKLGDVVTVTVEVQPSLATGTAEVFEGSTSLGVLAIAGGQGTLPVPGLSRGIHSLRAAYSGDACLLPASSTPRSVTIGDPPRLSIEDAQVFEGNSGIGTHLDFRVILSSSSTSNVTVSYQTADGTARRDSDYVAASGTVTIPAGNLAATLPVSILGETTREPDETFQVLLSNPTVAVLLDSVATGVIRDDDSGPPPPPGVTSPIGLEGDVGLTPFRFTVISPRMGPDSFKIKTQDKTATAASGDYVAIDDSLLIPAGQTQGTVTVYVKADSMTESDESFFLLVTNVDLVFYGNAIGTILNDDPLPRVSIEDGSVIEGGPGTTTVGQVVVRADRASSHGVSVAYQTRDGSATTANADYDAGAGTVFISPGSRTGTIPVIVRGDAVVEPTEFLTISLSSPSGGFIQDGLGSLYILADDAGTPPTVRVTEPNGGETLTLATQARVAWVSSANTTIDVHLSRDGGATWEMLGQNLYNAGYAYWKVEGAPTSHARMKVVARDYVNRTVEDVSDGDFAIVEAGPGEPPGATLVGVFEVHAVPGGVELKWQLAESPKAASVSIERREATSDTWTAVTAEAREVDGMNVALDADVDPGATYSYRLSARLEDGHEVRFDAPPVAIAGTPPGAPGLRIVPNPTHGAARIELTLARAGPARVAVVDVQGRQIAQVRSGFVDAGRHWFVWDGRGAEGPVPAGLYFLRCEAQGAVFLRRFAVVR